MNIHPRQLVKAFEEANPELFKRYYPRKYQSVSGYGSPKRAAVHMMTADFQFDRYEAGDRIGSGFVSAPEGQNTDRIQFLGLQKAAVGQILRYDVPTYWLKKDLMEAVLMTDLPDDLRLDEIRWPFDGMLIMLPDGMIKAPDGYEYTSFMMARLPANTQVGRLVYKSSQMIFMAGAITPEGNISTKYGFLSPEKFPVLGRWRQREEIPYQLTDPEQSETVRVDPKDEVAFSRALIEIGIGLLTLMHSRPQYVDSLPWKGKDPKKTRKVKVHPPSWIGLEYKVRRRESDRASSSGNGTPKRLHWTRGHQRMQAWGPNRSLRKPLWIEPYLSGGKAEGKEG